MRHVSFLSPFRWLQQGAADMRYTLAASLGHGLIITTMGWGCCYFYQLSMGNDRYLTDARKIVLFFYLNHLVYIMKIMRTNKRVFLMFIGMHLQMLQLL